MSLICKLIAAARLSMMATANEVDGSPSTPAVSLEPEEYVPTNEEIRAASKFNQRCVQCIYEGYQFCTTDNDDSTGVCQVP